VRKTAAFAIVSLGIAAGLPAVADETGFYAGANALGLLSTYHRADLDSAMTAAFSGADSPLTRGPSSVERTRYSWSVDVGYRVTRNLGVELSYMDLGSLSYSGFGTRPVGSISAEEVHLKLDFRSHGPALAVVGVLPMTNFWDMTARVGAFQARTNTNFRTTAGDGENSGSFSESSTSLLASVGAAFTVTTHCVLRLDYLRIQKIKEKGLDQPFNVDGVTAGLAYVL